MTDHELAIEAAALELMRALPSPGVYELLHKLDVVGAAEKMIAAYEARLYELGRTTGSATPTPWISTSVCVSSPLLPPGLGGAPRRID